MSKLRLPVCYFDANKPRGNGLPGFCNMRPQSRPNPLQRLVGMNLPDVSWRTALSDRKKLAYQPRSSYSEVSGFMRKNRLVPCDLSLLKPPSHLQASKAPCVVPIHGPVVCRPEPRHRHALKFVMFQDHSRGIRVDDSVFNRDRIGSIMR
jgi:hypothetical protein